MGDKRDSENFESYRPLPPNLEYLSDLAECQTVFADREDAGRTLAGMLARQELVNPLLLAVPAGGVPVAVAAAQSLGWPLEVAVVSKILLPWNTEAGYGALAWDGTLQLNKSMLAGLGLSAQQQAEGIARTRAKVDARVQQLMKPDGLADLSGRSAVLIDDGLASGFTLLTAVAALKKAAAESILVAVPTGHIEAALRLAAEADRVLCANLRSRYPFAVAAAYRQWQDVSEDEVRKALARMET